MDPFLPPCFLLHSCVFVQRQLLDRLRRLAQLFLRRLCDITSGPHPSQLQVQNARDAVSRPENRVWPSHGFMFELVDQMLAVFPMVLAALQ